MIIDLKTAKYKGVEFPFQTMTTVVGNRIISYTYPGSDRQSTERQGRLPREFTIVAVIPHDNYFELRDNLIRVLEDGEVGVLTHPTFGDIENVTNGKCTINETITELGRATITIPFKIDDGTGIPRQSENLASQVNTKSDAVITQLVADLGVFYKVSDNFPGNFTDAFANINGVLDSLTAATQIADPITENITDFTMQVNVTRTNIGQLIDSPTQLADSIQNLFESINNLYETPESTLAVFQSLFSFGDDDPDLIQTTSGLKERKNNRDLIRTNITGLALNYSYLNGVQSTFQTEVQIETVQQVLEDQYLIIKAGRLIDNSVENLKLPDDQSEPNTPLLSNESFEAIDQLRTQAQKTFENTRLDTSAIITIETPLIPLSVLVFTYYGSTDLVDSIAELNGIQQNAFVEGELRILTQ